MAELRPYPFRGLIVRMFRELQARRAIFDLPETKFFLGDPLRDLSVSFHGQEAATPLGPAAGPQSQMAQNLVLAWLGGSRIHELKTVQLNDELTIPRPCIDMQTVGYNVEWSQELKLEESLEEYVKGSMLIEMLVASGELELAAGYERTLYDMSVGYDLAGIRSERVLAFVHGMLDCSAVVDRLRKEIPDEFARFRDLDFQTRLSDTLTLSTFHGCPPDEIEKIIDFLLREAGLNAVVKLNPMLLGVERARELLNDVMGYTDIATPDSAFARDTTWEDAQGFCERLGDTADGLGLGFGVKFTNTLIVENRRDFFPAEEKEMYLSGPPLHILAMNLVAEFRQRFGDRYPISFSAGIDRKNFPDAVALGIVPITVCSDLLKPGGYARSKGYFTELAGRMDKVGAASIGDYAIRAYGLGGAALERLGLDAGSPERTACERALADGGDLRVAAGGVLHTRWVSEAALLNTEHYVPLATEDPRYHLDANAKPPRKIGSALELFDCITCDKCVPVCPNDANFTFTLPKLTVPIVKLWREAGGWASREDGELAIEEKHQIANFADFCNECGNCDVFCPEDGGPYIVKPRFFGSLADWREFSTLDGFFAERAADMLRVHGRIDGHELSLASQAEGQETFAGEGFELAFEAKDPLSTLSGSAEGEVDLTYYYILRWMRDAVYETDDVNYLTCL
jgi:putative selenate reductase